MRVLAICRDGTHRSQRLASILERYGIECDPAGYSRETRLFSLHYKQKSREHYDAILVLDKNFEEYENLPSATFLLATHVDESNPFLEHELYEIARQTIRKLETTR